MKLPEAFELIRDVMFSSSRELKDGMPSGKNEDLNYDEELIIEIAKACLDWQGRQTKLKDPYSVWHFDGSTWNRVTGELLQHHAYREWYNLTDGGSRNNNEKCETYYHLGGYNDKLEGRHVGEDDYDGFSVGYLLNKTFGD